MTKSLEPSQGGAQQQYLQGPIMSLPNEITSIFLSLLPAADCGKVAQVCKTWNSLVPNRDHTYTIAEGNVQVTDKTYGFATVEFFKEQSQAGYIVKINNKGLTFPGKKKDSVLFVGSQSFIFEGDGKFLKVTEIDASNTTPSWVDPRSTKATYTLYNNKPPYAIAETSKEMDINKLKLFQQNNTNVTSGVILRNRHGIAILSLRTADDKDYLFWANPQQDSLQLIPAHFYICRGSGTDADSYDKQLSLRFNRDKTSFLNDEEAEVYYYFSSEEPSLDEKNNL